MLKFLLPIGFLFLALPAHANGLSPWFGAQDQQAFQLAIPEPEQAQALTEDVATDTCAIESCSTAKKPVNSVIETAAAP